MLIQAPFLFLGLMKLFRIFIALIFSASCVSASAEKVFDFNATCQQAYREITSLKLDSGKRLLTIARQQNPDNLIPELLDSYIDFFVLFFNEDPQEYKLRKPVFNARLELLEQGPESSPFYHYSRAVVNLHKAIVEIKFGERFSAAWDFKRAFSLIKTNIKQHPNFSPNKLIYGPLQVGVGTIPPGYKWMANIFGLSGSIKEGMQNMRSFINSNDVYSKIFFNEASFYYCYLCFYFENNSTEVFRYINDNKLDVVNNHLFTYLAANLGINDKRSEYAKQILLRKNNSAAYFSTPVWDLELGYIYLHHLETDKAAEHFSRFVNNFKGKFYIKEAYQKLAFAYYLAGNNSAAEQARINAIKKGNTDTDADKRAHNESKTGNWPNPTLLKARLLNDGGYYAEALAMLAGKTQADFNKPEDQLEFVYRVGRIYDDSGRDDEALKFYNITMQQGKDRKEYFAARAALQAGMLLEKKGRKQEAIQYYQRCLDMEDHEFKNSIDQRAKTGIARCKGE